MDNKELLVSFVFALGMSTAAINRQTKKQGEKIMAALADFEAQFTRVVAQIQRIDTTTNEMATEIQALKEQIEGGGLPASVEAMVLSRLTVLADQLEQTGKIAPPVVDPAPVDPEPNDPAPVDPAPVDPAPVDPEPQPEPEA